MIRQMIDDFKIQGERATAGESLEESGSNMANGESKSRQEPQQHASEARRESNRSLPALSMEDAGDAPQTTQKRALGGSKARDAAVKQKSLSRATIDTVKNSPSSLQESEGAQDESNGTRDTKPPSKPEADQEGGQELEEESKKNASSKSDRSKLRKGKWMVEEEEYTSRTIQHFSSGLLTLPDGATLRSYLADKLNCDPMRITKKFTGACCLGRRVYNLRYRPQASHVETEMAKAEMDDLEKRFRMRVEHDQSRVPLARRQEMLLAEGPTGVSTLYPIQNAAAPWLQSFESAATMSANKPSIPLNFDGNLALGTPTNATNNNGWRFAGTVPSAAGQWLLQNTGSAEAALSSAPAQTQSDQSLQALNSIITQLAWAQAAATLTPAISQLTVAKLQQQQLRVAFEEQLKAEASRMAVPEIAAEAAKPPAQNAWKPEISPADQLRQGYEAYLKSLQKPAPPVQVKPVASAGNVGLQTTTNQHASLNPTSKTPNNPYSAADRQQQSNAMESVPKSSPSPPQREADNYMKSEDDASGNNSTESAGTEQASTDEEAGTILFGFLNSLRKSYENAIEVEVDENAETGVSENGKKGGARATSSTSVNGRTKKKRNDPEATFASNGSQEKSGKDSSDDIEPQVDSKGENRTIQSATPISPLAVSSLFQKAVATNGQRRPASVTDTSMSRSEISSGASSQPNESSSSMDDSDSKSDNQDPSSSEESEKDYPVPQRSHGPPRKRHKACTNASTVSRSETSSGATSQPNESLSSMDDSDSKSDNQDPSSSEESEKYYPVPQRSLGPPRKRHKTCKKIQEFTTQNVLEHSKRMKYKLERPRKPGKY